MSRHSYSTIFNKGEDIIEIIIRDQTGHKLEERRCNMSDKKELVNILKWVKSKYNAQFDDDWLSVDNEFLKF